jgi:hypothetical protein
LAGRTACGGRPLEDGPWRTAQAEGSARPSASRPTATPTGGRRSRLPNSMADGHPAAGRPLRPSASRPTATPTGGRRGRPPSSRRSERATSGWVAVRHAVRRVGWRTACRPPCRPPCRPLGRVADGMPSGGRPWGCRTRPDVLRTLTWTSGRVTTLIKKCCYLKVFSVILIYVLQHVPS